MGPQRIVCATTVAVRPEWSQMPAVMRGELHEIKSCDILQPGPAALTDGLEQLHRPFSAWAPSRGIAA